MKNPSRRGIFHPNDIKTLGIGGSPGPLSAPLPGLTKLSPKPPLSPMVSSTFGPPSSSGGSHSRSPSVAGIIGGSGSLGRSEARRAQSQTGFGKYTEDDEENYEDIFGKPNGNGM
jgi:hypothetical protein